MRFQQIKGNDSLRIKKMAKEFDDDFSSAFNDLPMRAMIWSDPKNDNLILIKVLASKEDGNFIKYQGQYQVAEADFFCDRKMERGFIDGKSRDIAVNALVKFISRMTEMRFPISKILLDLSVLRYNSVKVGKSASEEGSIEVHICTYVDEADDSYNISEAKDLVGAKMVSM